MSNGAVSTCPLNHGENVSRAARNTKAAWNIVSFYYKTIML